MMVTATSSYPPPSSTASASPSSSGTYYDPSSSATGSGTTYYDPSATATTYAPPTNDTTTAISDPVVTCSAPGSVYYSASTLQLMDDFIALSPSSADAAYSQLYSQGLSAAPALWKIASDPASASQIFQGSAYINPLSSRPARDITVAEAALLLLDGIIRQNPQPYDTVGFRSAFGSTMQEGDFVAEALAFYGDWLNDLSIATYTQTTALSYSRTSSLRTPPAGFECSNVTRPATATSLTPLVSWVGTPLPVYPTLNATDPWTTRPGSSTPIDRTKPCTVGAKPWIIICEPTTPRPYNCIAWALNHTDAWYWPDGVMSTDCNTSKPVGNKNYTDMLGADGYDASKETACNGACPAGKGPKVMMIFKFTNSGGICLLELNHGMRKDGDKWTSKNGQTGVYDGIADADVDTFLDRFYPEPPTRVKKCYCKP